MVSTLSSVVNTFCKYCHHKLAPVQISRHQTFCSRECKNDSQKRKITLKCGHCSNTFSIFPYLKRKSNYCSVKCYRDATRKKKQKICVVCGEKFSILNCLYKEGWGKYCSRKCQFFIYESRRKRKICPQCNKEFYVPPSLENKRKYCSKKCKDDFERDYIKRRCRNCKKYFFLPRWELEKGKGTFCSRKCFQNYNGETSIESLIRKVLEKKGVDFKQETKIGKYYADFLIPDSRLIIECDGEYWHRSDYAKRRDLRKDKFLASEGYEVYRFAEKEIKESRGSCVEKAFAHFRW